MTEQNVEDELAFYDFLELNLYDFSIGFLEQVEDLIKKVIEERRDECLT